MADAAKLQEIHDTLQAAYRRKKFRAIDFFKPYAKQKEFFMNGAAHRERLFMAGNQLGKTLAGAIETAYHLTGDYPEWWTGRRFKKPVTAWVAGETGLLVRDGPQKLLCGQPGVTEAFGTGFIPLDRFIDKSLARGVTDAYDTIQVKHSTRGVEDGISTLTFKSYESGREKFQSTTLDFWWADEEPDEAIYGELMARITATGGMGFVTFTPLKGRSAVVLRYLDEVSPDRTVTTMTIDDVGHISKEDKAKVIAGYKAHEREARAMGVPILGSGKIFTATEETLKEARIAFDEIPRYWKKLWGIDFGIGHPFAAVLGAWDVDNDIIHILHCIRIADQLPIMHASAMKTIGVNVPVAWPQDGTAREKTSGKAVSTSYKEQGLRMLDSHATWPDGGLSTEAGILEQQEREATGRIKVADHLSDWFEERRFYHRKDGQVNKVKDDLMSATRVLLMAKRFAQAVNLGGEKVRRRSGQVATDVDFDPF